MLPNADSGWGPFGKRRSVLPDAAELAAVHSCLGHVQAGKSRLAFYARMCS